MLEEPGWLLSSLAQSTAAVVAIIGGFLVSRLVQLSSEREGLRRQLQQTDDELGHARESHAAAHRRRLDRCRRAFFDDVIDDLAGADLSSLDRDALVADHLPVGSSDAEMREYLDALVVSLSRAQREVMALVRSDDTSRLSLDELRTRGLVVADADEDCYLAVVKAVAERLPASGYGMTGITSSILSGIVIDPVGRAAEIRRLDDAIRDEQAVEGQLATYEALRERTLRSLSALGQPIGVRRAVLILALDALVGVVVPVAVLAAGISPLPTWAAWLLVGLFGAGLAAVLGYIVWYIQELREDSSDPVAVARK